MAFKGFTPETLQFFSDLAANNHKPWFDSHRKDYDTYVMEPARELVSALGDHLRQFAPNVVADPRVNKSIFRIYRDTRFSKDKTPYKTNLALWFPVEQSNAKFEHPGYYFHLESDNLMLGAGIHGFSKPLLKAYRDAVVNPDLGPTLAKAIKTVAEKGYGIGEKTYKRIPQGYDQNHKLAEFLLYSGVTTGINLGIPDELMSADLVGLCLNHFKLMAPIVDWLEIIAQKA